MQGIAINQVLILILQCGIVATLLLLLFRLRTIFGLGLFYIALGLFKFMHYFYTQAFSIEVIAGVNVSIGSTVMYSGILFAVLLIYIREDALEARKVIYALMIFNIFFALLLYVTSISFNEIGFINRYNLPKSFFEFDLRYLIIGTSVIFIDSLVLIALYEAISRLLSSMFLRIFLTMAFVLIMHALLFSFGASFGTDLLLHDIKAGLISKLIAVPTYSILFWIYLIPFEKRLDTDGKNSSSFSDIFNLLTYRQKYEILSEEKALQKIELDQTEERFKAIFEKARNVIYVISPDGKLQSINPIFEELTGWSVENWIGQSFTQLVHPDDLNFVVNSVKSVLAGEIVETYELRIKIKSGEYIIVEFTPSLLKSGQEIIGILGIATDLTERKKNEEELKHAEEVIIDTIENMTDGFVSLSTEWVYTNVNFRAAEMFGRKPEQLIGKHIWTEFPEGIGQPFYNNYYKAVETQQTIYFEDFYSPWDRWFENRIIPSKDGLSIFFQDITDRKQAEKEIAILANALKSINDCVCITDMQNNFTFMNQSFLNTYGYKESELIGKKINLIQSEKNPQELLDKILPATLHEGWYGELWNKRKDGSEFPVYLSTKTFYDKSGKSAGIIGVATDITKRRLAEKELIQAKELAEQSNRLKDAFIANMSHEIRTPLNGILGLSSVVKNLYSDYLRDDENLIFDGIENSGKRLIRTVDMILNYSRIQTGEFPVSPNEMELSLICKNLISEFNFIAESKSIELSFNNKLNCAITIIADEYSIINSISNLIDNAIKFTDHGFVKVTLYKGDNEEVLIDIKDSGIGISSEYIKHLFEPYQQENIGYGRAYEGIGLGLSIVKKFLNLNGADIFVKSEKGKGSLFTINFGTNFLTSSTIESKSKTEKIFTKKEGSAKPLILVVEDDIFNQQAIKMFIRISYDAIVTDSSEGAIEIMKNNKVDLVLMDISIRGSMNGLELTKEFKATKEYSNIPVIAITAHAFESDRKNALKAGCDDFLSKPFTKTLLMEKIARHV